MTDDNKTFTDAAKALITAQKNMTAPKKDATNPAFRSTYADLASVMAACLKPLHDAGFAVYHTTAADERGDFVECVFLHEGGHMFTNRMHLRVNKNDMQGYGSAITYARRYTLQALAGLAADDDDGNAAAEAPPKPAPRNEAPAYVRADVEGVIAALAEAASAAEVADVKAKAKGLIFWCQAEMVPWFNELRAAFAKAQEFFATSEGEAAE
jgi:hypothetical protein